MLDHRKIRLMTKLAIYENGEGKEDIAMSHYFRRDFLRLRILLMLLMVTIGFCAVLGLFVVYNMEYFVANAVTLDYFRIGVGVVLIYLVVLAIYILSCLVYNMIYYNRSKSKLSKYFRMLRRMRTYYTEEEQEEE